ncbi:mucin-2-like isoform X2 [Eurosta solidaginis]
MTLLPVYYPNMRLRRMRLQLLPPKKYSHRGILPINHNHIRNNFRYFNLRYLPAPTNGLNKMKWLHPTFPYANMHNVLKATTKANIHIISPEQFRNDGLNRDTYFTKPILSTANYCANIYKLDGHNTNTSPICIENMPIFPTPLTKMPLSNIKSTSTTMRFTSYTNSPYTKHFLPTNSFVNAINTSNIYFTIGDAITPRTLNTSKFKKDKIAELKNYVTYLPAGNIKPKSSSVVSELLTMASNPIYTQQKTLVYQQPNETSTYTIDEYETKNKSKDLYFEDAHTTNSYVATELTTITNTCSNFSLYSKMKCLVEIGDSNKEVTEVISTQQTAVPTPLPLTISTVISTVSTPLSTMINENILTTVNTTGEWYTVTSKFALPTDPTLSRPVYRRKKIVGINRRLVFKEKLKVNNGSSIPTTLATPLRSYEQNNKEKRKYIFTTLSTSAQTIPWTRSTEDETSTRMSDTPKSTKTKFQIKSRSRWTPNYDKTYRKAKTNATTSTKMTITPSSKPSTAIQPKRSLKTIKLRSKINRQNRRAKILKITTTESTPIPHLRSQATTTMTSSSTPESAIMRISNIHNDYKLSIKKNISSNSLIGIPHPSKEFVAELPIVTYFKEVTESRQM